MPTYPVGLDITPSALIAVSVKKKGKGYSVDHHAVFPLAAGIVADGEVRDVEALAQALRDLWEQEKFASKQVSVGLANTRCITRVVELPPIRSKKTLRQALGFQVTDHLPIPLEEAVFDFHTIGKHKDPETGATMVRHLLVATYRETVEKYRDAIQAAGLKMRRIDLSAFALMRSAVREEHNQEAVEGEPEPVVVLCDIGYTSSNVVVAKNGVCEFNRMVSFGSHTFTQTLSEQFGWTAADAERVAMDAGVLPFGGVEVPNDAYADSRQVMQYVVDTFANDLRTSIDYFVNSSGVRIAVTQVLVSGKGATYRGIEQRLMANLGIPVSVLDASHRLDESSIERLGMHAEYGVALGLAMEDAA